MAISYLPPPLAIFAPGISSLLGVPSPIASCFFVVYIGVLFFCYFYLFDTLCVCCSWGIHSNSPPPNCFVCAVNLLHIRSTAHHLLSGLFLHPHRDELLTPPSASVFSLHAIGFLPAVIIRIMCFFLLLFIFFPVLLVSFLVFMFFPCCCLIFYFIPLFFYTFSFMFMLLIRLYPFSLICPFLLWSKPWVVDVNDILAFELMMMKFGMMILLSRPKNKRYICIR